MLEAIRSLLGRSGSPEIDAVAAWAKKRGLRCKREKDGDGFAIDGSSPVGAWRIEWGAPQRRYIAGHELRIRAALELPPDLQMLVMTQALEEVLAREAFELGTQGNQTLVGDAVLEETRWLVMFPRIAFNQSKTMRRFYAGVSSLDYEGGSWLEARLAKALERAAGQWLGEAPPFVLMTLRGRLYLRMRLDRPDVDDIAAALELFEIAAEEALRVARARGDAPMAWPAAKQASAWQKLPPDTQR